MKSNSHSPRPSPGTDCASFADLLPLLDEGILEAETHGHLRHHVTTCAYYQAQVAADQRIAGVFRRYFESPPLRLFSPEELMQMSDKESQPASGGQAPSPPTTLRHRLRSPARPEPMRTIMAIGAIAAVVVLFVVLFQGLGHSRQTASPTGATPTSPRTTPLPTQAPIESYLIPVIAPSNPQTVYRLAPASASSNQLVFQRSANGGATWHNFFLPAQSNGPLPTIFASPLNAQEVFVSLGGTLVNNTCVSQPPVGSNSTLSSGNHVCGLQYLSQDGGAHWTELHYASNDILGGFSAPNAFAWTQFGSLHTLQAQGTRLYSALAPWIPGMSSFNGRITPQIVTSADGGLTWQLADNGLPLTNNMLCDYAPAPIGSTVFALLMSAQSDGCVGNPLTLWRSTDAGGHWTRVGSVPEDVDFGIAAVSTGDAAQPLVYLNTASGSCPASAYIAFNPSSAICDGAPTNLRGSVDGGKTWHSAPTLGYPNPKQNPGPPLGVLSDGSVLFLVQNQFYAWKFGDPAWHRVGPTISGGFQYALLTSSSNGQQTLWVVTAQSSSTFAIRGYPL